MMKKAILNVFAMTGITLVVLSLVALCYNASFLCLETVFQALGLNLLIYLGIMFINTIEFRFYLLETGLKLVYSIALVLIAGKIFGWYQNLSAPVLGGMALVILLLCGYLDMLSLRNEIKEINDLIGEK
ncbi:MAG: hypothetical protein J5537_09565 [Lachnospiraceae bacterium]|nr:hypothetical protein [Lachnospiraceae bacterium]